MNKTLYGFLESIALHVFGRFNGYSFVKLDVFVDVFSFDEGESKFWDSGIENPWKIISHHP